MRTISRGELLCVSLILIAGLLLLTGGCRAVDDKYWSFSVTDDTWGDDFDEWFPLVFLFGIGLLPIVVDIAIMPVTHVHDAAVAIDDEYDVSVRSSRATEYLLCPETGVRWETHMVTCPIHAVALSGAEEIVVDATGGGDHTTLSSAISAAPYNGRILVKPGTYRGGITLYKRVSIVGLEGAEKTIIETENANGLTIHTQIGLRGLTFRTKKTDGKKDEGYFGLAVQKSGFARVEACTFTSDSYSNVLVSGSSARIEARECISENGAQVGFFFNAGGTGTLDDCTIRGNEYAGVEANASTGIFIRNSRILNGRSNGLSAHHKGQIEAEDCVIEGQRYANVRASDGGAVTIRRSRIGNGEQGGLFAYKTGTLNVEDCDVYGHGLSAVEVREGSQGEFRRCRVYDNAGYGFYFHKGAKGTIADCEIRGNGSGPIEISQDSTVTRTGNSLE